MDIIIAVLTLLAINIFIVTIIDVDYDQAIHYTHLFLENYIKHNVFFLSGVLIIAHDILASVSHLHYKIWVIYATSLLSLLSVIFVLHYYRNRVHTPFVLSLPVKLASGISIVALLVNIIYITGAVSGLSKSFN